MSKKRTRRSSAAERKMDSWSTRFDRTWLSFPDACRAMDQKLAEMASKHVDAAPEQALLLRCEETAALLATLGIAPSNAIYCTIQLALLAELLLCAEFGGILRKDTVTRFAGSDLERYVLAEVLRLLRNAVCHPVADRDRITALSDFVEINFHLERWAPGLRAQPGRLASRNVAFFGLAIVDSLGRWQADHWGVKLRNTRR